MVSCGWLIGIWMSSTSLDLPSQTERVSSWFAFFIHPFTTASTFQLRLLILLFVVDVYKRHRIKKTSFWHCTSIYSACRHVENTNSSQKDPKRWINKLRAKHWSRSCCLLFVKAINTSWRWTLTVYLIRQGEWGGWVRAVEWIGLIDMHCAQGYVACKAFSPRVRRDIENPICTVTLPFHYRRHNGFLIWFTDPSTNTVMGWETLFVCVCVCVCVCV